MKTQAFIAIFDLNLVAEIGTYGPSDMEPEVHQSTTAPKLK